jgi:FkbM family methyltransferase
MLTYAQNFEDVILERLFKEADKGFYVDIGAWDPTVHSVTRHFYDRGWHGVNVEPIAARLRMFEQERPRDINVLSAVGPERASMTFYECEEESYLSTLDGQVASEMRERGLTVQERQVEVITLNDIFDAHCLTTVDFLKIDVEGFEGELLKGLDLTRHRPRCLIVEATRPAMAPSGWEDFEEIGTWSSWEPSVLAAGYILAYFDGLNRFYLRTEDAQLGKRLVLPPGIYDGIEYPAIATLNETLQAVANDRAAKQNVIHRLVAENDAIRFDRAMQLQRLDQDLKAVRSDQAAKQEAIDRLAAENKAMRSDQAGKQEVIERLVAENKARRCDQSAKQEVIDRLVAENNAIRTDRAAERALARLVAEGDMIQTDLEAKTDDLAQRLIRKSEVSAKLSSELVGYRSTLGGALEVTYRSRRTPGLRLSGGRYIGALEADGTARTIAMDVMAIQFGISGGVEVYMRTLVQALLTIRRIGVVLVCLESQREKLQAIFGDKVGYYAFKTRPLMKAAGKMGSLIRRTNSLETIDRVPASFSRLREEIGAQVLHCPVQCYSLLDFNIPAVFHLHDLQHLHFPENFSLGDIAARNDLYRLSADLSHMIIASSDFVRNDIISKMGVPAEKTVRIPVTWDPKVEAGLGTLPAAGARRKYKLPDTFGLYPAQFWPHKNHVRLVEALAIVRDRMKNIDFKLVFTGNRDHSAWAQVSATIDRLGLRDHIVCLDYVPVEHLAGIYKNAAFCVMPSLFEASSYPVIEAQVLGCPAMCSNVTSLPELVRGGAGLLFDPYDPEDISSKMVQWLCAPDEAAACAERAAHKVRREHGMDAYASAIASVYQQIAPL